MPRKNFIRIPQMKVVVQIKNFTIENVLDYHIDSSRKRKITTGNICLLGDESKDEIAQKPY